MYKHDEVQNLTEMAAMEVWLDSTGKMPKVGETIKRILKNVPEEKKQEIYYGDFFNVAPWRLSYIIPKNKRNARR